MNHHTPLHRQISHQIAQRTLLTSTELVVVAISGGQDSLCLGQIMVDLGWRVVVAHLDHRWRADSGLAAAAVAQIAQGWGVPFHLAVATTIPDSEAAARIWRYGWLGNLAQELGAGVVLTGHTATDRAETMLFNLIRGAGLAGASSLDWVRPLVPGVRLVRPLLGVQRQETLAFCQMRGLAVWEDPTNQDLRYSRNRLRLEVLPYLSEHFNPQVVRHLTQAADLAGAEEDYLAAVSREHFQTLWRQDPPGLQQRGVGLLPVALQRRVVRLFLQQGGAAGDFQAVEAVRSLVGQPEGARTSSLYQGKSVLVRRGWLVWA